MALLNDLINLDLSDVTEKIIAEYIWLVINSVMFNLLDIFFIHTKFLYVMVCVLMIDQDWRKWSRSPKQGQGNKFIETYIYIYMYVGCLVLIICTNMFE